MEALRAAMTPSSHSPSGFKVSPYFVPLALVAVVLWFGFGALDQYNITWDEALGDYFFGQRYLAFFTSLDQRYLDFELDPFPAGHSPNLELSPFRSRPWEYSPVASTLAAATSRIFADSLALVDQFDGFHALNLLLAAVFFWFYYDFCSRFLGRTAALFACLLLLTCPRLVFHGMANIKDFPHMVLFAVALMAWYRAYDRGSTSGMLGAGLLWGLALGTRPNALFLPLIPLAVTTLSRLPQPWRHRRIYFAGLAGGTVVIGLATWFMSWPYLWADPVGRLAHHLRFLVDRGEHLRSESVAPVVQALGLTTPPGFLVLALFGLALALQRCWRRDPIALFLVAWCGVVLSRYLLPRAVNYDGVRHFLELFPALAGLAGLAASRFIETIDRRISSAPLRRLALAGATAIAVLPAAFAVAKTHPYQSAYWNVFAGGLAGARQAGLPQAGDYWGSSYRQGMRWLNRNAVADALVAVPVAEHAVRLVAPLRLRSDLILLPVTTPFSPTIEPGRLQLTREAARRRPLYVMFVVRADWFNQLIADCLDTLEPIARWDLDGEPILLIYQYPGDENKQLPEQFQKGVNR